MTSAKRCTDGCRMEIRRLITSTRCNSVTKDQVLGFSRAKLTVTGRHDQTLFSGSTVSQDVARQFSAPQSYKISNRTLQPLKCCYISTSTSTTQASNLSMIWYARLLFSFITSIAILGNIWIYSFLHIMMALNNQQHNCSLRPCKRWQAISMNLLLSWTLSTSHGLESNCSRG